MCAHCGGPDEWGLAMGLYSGPYILVQFLSVH